MNENTIICPWSQYTPGYFPICEEKLCEWIKQPANSYSNLGFIICGLLLIYLYFNKKSPNGLSFGMASIIVGVCSFSAHSTGIGLFSFLDYASIFFIFALFAANNAIFDRKIKSQNTIIVALAYFIPVALFTYFVVASRNILFAVSVIGLIYWESRILKKQNKKFLVASMKKVLGFFAIAVICLALDITKVICDPQNHFFQMHSLWHIFNSVSIYFLARHLDEHHI
jgi:Ceramidase